MMKKKLWIILGLTAVAGVAGVLVLAWWWQGAAQPISRTVLKQAGFGIWYPGKQTGYRVDRATVKFKAEAADKLVTFEVGGDGNKLTFTEQVVPESFADVPQVYDKLTEKLHEYSKVETINGTASVTRPDELAGKQTLVMKARGTLMFIKPENDLNPDAWRALLNNLEFVH